MKSISVNTEFGELCAIVGGDAEVPEIIVYLKNENGHELMLADIADNTVLGDNSEMHGLCITVYRDPRAEDYSDCFILAGEEINSPDAMWT